MLVPARPARPQARRRAGGPDPEALPRGVVRARAADLDRAREPQRRARGAPVRPRRRRAARRRARASGSPATSGPARRRSRCSSRKRRDGGRPHGRDLLAPAPARAAARHLPGRRPVLAERADRPALRGRPAARRRRRRRADVAVGARAALHDRQHALRGRQGDHGHDEPDHPGGRRRAGRADRAAHGLAPVRDLRRPEADVRRGPAARDALRAARAGRRSAATSRTARPARGGRGFAS